MREIYVFHLKKRGSDSILTHIDALHSFSASFIHTHIHTYTHTHTLSLSFLTLLSLFILTCPLLSPSLLLPSFSHFRQRENERRHRLRQRPRRL